MTKIGLQERRVGNVTILNTNGQARVGLRFGSSTVPLPKAIQSLLEEGQNQILLDFARVDWVDAGDLGELVSTYITVNQNGGQIKLVHLTERVSELMASTKLLAVFDTYQTEAEALKSFENGSVAAAPENTSVPA